MTGRLTAALVATMAVAAIAIGCGGDGDSEGDASAGAEPGTTGAAQTGEGPGDSGDKLDEGADEAGVPVSSLDKEDYLRRANALCAKQSTDYEDELGAHIRRAENKGWSEARLVATGVRTILLPISEAKLAALRGLGAPEGDEDEVGAALDAQEEAIEATRAMRRIESVAATEAKFAEATRMLESYGLDRCGYTP